MAAREEAGLALAALLIDVDALGVRGGVAGGPLVPLEAVLGELRARHATHHRLELKPREQERGEGRVEGWQGAEWAVEVAERDVGPVVTVVNTRLEAAGV